MESNYDADTTRRLVREASFEILQDATEWQREGDKDVDYLWVLARRPDPYLPYEFGNVWNPGAAYAATFLTLRAGARHRPDG